MKSEHELPPIEELYNRYGPMVYRRALAILGSDAEAKDAMQEIFIRVLESSSDFRGESAPTTWLYRITTNMCLNRLRDSKRRHGLAHAWAETQVTSGRRLEITPMVRQILSKIPPDYAAAGIYYYLDGMTHEEIAKILKVSRRTAGNWVDEFQTQFKKEWEITHDKNA